MSITKPCGLCGQPVTLNGFLFRCKNPECRSNARKSPPTLPICQLPKSNGQGHVWLSRTAHENLMRYWQEGERAREILLRLGNGKPEMSLLQVVEDLAASVRDSSGGPVAGSI